MCAGTGDYFIGVRLYIIQAKKLVVGDWPCCFVLHEERLSDLFLRRKKKLEVDLGELKDERESLSSFLRSKLKVGVTSSGSKVFVDSENLSSKELKRFVNKFVYHRNLNTKYWVALEGDVVKINKFKHSEKRGKQKGTGTPPSIIKHGW
jgi:hypothetical protein